MRTNFLPDAEKIAENLDARFVDEIHADDITSIQLDAIKAFCDEVEKRGWDNQWKHHLDSVPLVFSTESAFRELRKELGL